MRLVGPWGLNSEPFTTLWLRWHSRTRIINREATTYARLGTGATPQLAAARQLLGALSGEAEPEEMIAWAMIE